MRVIAVFILIFTLFASPARADVLSGDVGLACEALLCLSSGVRPGECGPSLARYFGINMKKWGDTLQARRNFLNLCPTSQEPGLPTLVDAIVNAAGQCSADVLNRVLSRRITIVECDDDKYWLPDEERCYEKVIVVVDNVLPNYCKTYADHEYTWKVRSHYVGEVMQGGKWVDEF